MGVTDLWHYAINRMMVERCKRSRGEWAWTCEQPPTLNMSKDINRYPSFDEMHNLIGSLNQILKPFFCSVIVTFHGMKS